MAARPAAGEAAAGPADPGYPRFPSLPLPLCPAAPARWRAEDSVEHHIHTFGGWVVRD